MIELQVDTIFILAEKQTSNENWLGAFKDIRTFCTYLGLPDMNIEFADKRGLQPVFSFSVERTDLVLGKWPILRPQIIEILGSQPWLALELLRRGKDLLTLINNSVTVVVTIEEKSQLDWTNVRDEIAKLLEEAGFGYIAVEIGRGVVFNGADKDSRILPATAYALEARPGKSIGPRGSIKSAGTFGCFVRLRFPKSDNWKIMALTCHHALLPNISIHPKAKEWDIHGILPTDQTNLTMDMPSHLDHMETLASWNKKINEIDTAAYRAIKMRLQDPQDFLTPIERRKYELEETAIAMMKNSVRKAEEFFGAHSEPFGHLYAASGLRQQYPPATPSVSFDWALLNVYSPRLSKNYLLPVEEASYLLQSEFLAFSKEIALSDSKLPPLESKLFMIGRSTGFTMGTYLGKAETTICSWKADEKGNIKQTITCEHAIQPVRGIHSDNSFYFGRAGDSGAAILDQFGAFVGLYFAGNDYTGSGYFSAAKDLFSDIKRMTSAEEVELLPIS